MVLWLSICRPACVAGVARVETDSPCERGEVYSANSDCRVYLQSSRGQLPKVIVAILVRLQ